MKLKLLTIAAGVALLATSITAKAQKTYKEGIITYSITTAAGTADSKTAFKADSNVTTSQMGPATIKFLSAGDFDYLAVLVSVPVANMKKAAIATPAELEQMGAAIPEITYTTTTETKQISGFNCKKVTAKDAKGTMNFDVWVTTDISIPVNSISSLYKKVTGVPVQFQTYLNSQLVSVVLKSVSDEKNAPDTFKVPADYERISFADLQALGGKR